MEQETVRGYKAFNSDWTCRGFQYEVGKKYIKDDEIIMCRKGFHFCRCLIDCFNFYPFQPETKIAVVEASGTIVENDNKCCTDQITIIREVEWKEVLRLVNVGTGNSGLRNSGYRNSGDRNSGDFNSGDFNSGDFNSGDLNSGYRNSGDRNSGDRNSGDRNSGYRNSGDRNSGDRNSGDRNSGYRNSGYRNSGYRNSGDFNSGDWNKTNHSSGCFNTAEQTIFMFNKQSDWTFSDWKGSRARIIMAHVSAEPVVFIDADEITEQEKEKYPDYKTTGGYLKKRTTEEIFKIQQDNWNRLSEEDKASVMSLPNFDAEIFEEITGIKI